MHFLFGSVILVQFFGSVFFGSVFSWFSCLLVQFSLWFSFLWFSFLFGSVFSLVQFSLWFSFPFTEASHTLDLHCLLWVRGSNSDFPPSLPADKRYTHALSSLFSLHHFSILHALRFIACARPLYFRLFCNRTEHVGRNRLEKALNSFLD